jgi:transcriptional regulator with XRE-family HTH domain
MGFGEELKYWRAERSLTFRLLSERSYIDVGYLHRLENDHATQPSRNIVLRVAIGLGLDLDETNELLLAAGHVPLYRNDRVSVHHQIHA